MIYFTADLHFYHKNIIKHASRPFQNVEAMNKKIMDNWNDTISFDDDIYILGDVTLKGSQSFDETIFQLKGKKYLIYGNHDKFMEESLEDNIFTWVKGYDEILYENTHFILSHYPFLEWNGSHKGSISLHGHQHNHAEYNAENRKQGIKRYDVGVDANDFRPISAKEIISFFENV